MGTETRLSAAGSSDTGLVRTGNEDAWLAGHRLAVVADGMGGHAAGEVASRIAVDTLAAAFAADPTAAGAVAAVHAAHAAVLRRAQTDPACAGMGTTVCALAITDDAGPLLLHVGDSRAYGIDGIDAVQLTWDDTLAFALVEAGQLTVAQAAADPRRHMLTQALGLPRGVRVRTARPARWPARLVLASDGLPDMVPAATIGTLAGAVVAPQAAADALVVAALAAGGHDNVTAVVADLILAS